MRTLLRGGRVVDPGSGFDGVADVLLNDGRVEAVGPGLQSVEAEVVDVAGLVVGPGFVDVHSHVHSIAGQRLQAMDGVTTALELEVGTGDVDAWYAQREQKSLINYGVSAGHLAARMAAMHEPVTFLPTGEAARRPATDTEIAE
ncbi:MAG TPA: amidohydrolase family protein, partial [Amycolatopsis sp.]|uniref:amidohydrolase family protein n=1 Tax=Amycolatopsis sp. TaxID=37632 RepID=UPI002F3F9FE7